MDKRLAPNRTVPKRVLALLLATAAFQAGARDACAPRMEGGWVRLGPATMPMMAGFGRIANPCPVPVEIASASSAAFAEVSIHETRNVDGVNRMREVEGLRIAPDDAVVLKPGGLHLMLMRPLAQLKEGSKVVVNFKLQDGREFLSELVVRKPVP